MTTKSISEQKMMLGMKNLSTEKGRRTYCFSMDVQAVMLCPKFELSNRLPSTSTTMLKRVQTEFNDFVNNFCEHTSKSDSKKVVLHSVSWKTSGLFRCEVSAEAPSFASAQGEARMEVVCK
nr:unnamed protein product [Callosobruchus analis]